MFESHMTDLFNFAPFIACAGIFRIAFYDLRWQSRSVEGGPEPPPVPAQLRSNDPMILAASADHVHRD
jgi:hypothetical protein